MRLRAFAVVLLMFSGSCAAASPLADLTDAIAARLLLMNDVARYKWNHAQPIVDPEREAALLERATADAVALGLPEAYARRVLAAQIEASRTLQLKLFATWRSEQQPPFPGVPDLAAVQRPGIDGATHRLLEQLKASLCPLTQDDARTAIETPPTSLADQPAAWSIAIASLWSMPDESCPH